MTLLAIVGLCGDSSVAASPVTVRTKSELRQWETVTDRSRPLAWPWADGADKAVLTFSNRLTRTVSSVTVAREAGASRGACGHPVAAATDEALVAVTLMQTAAGIEVGRETAELAYVPGVADRAITVRTKASRDWGRVRELRLAGYDATWWNVPGPSGYEVVWAVPPGPHRIVREFEDAGVVDEAVLKFGLLGLAISFR